MLKIAFLFLTISGVYHEAYWKNFFKDHEEQYSLYVHSKNGVLIRSFFSQYQMHETVPTTWENTMYAQIVMLREALKDPANQKFVFVSESTIPLQDFEYVYNELISTEKSIFWFQPSPHLDPNNKRYYSPRRRHLPFPEVYECKNAQWIILNRKHAELMVNDTTWLDVFCTYPHDQEHYPSSFLALKGLLGEVVNKHTTYVCWSKRSPAGYREYPYTFTNLRWKSDYQLLAAKIKKGYLFARKFAPKCDLSCIDHLLGYTQGN